MNRFNSSDLLLLAACKLVNKVDIFAGDFTKGAILSLFLCRFGLNPNRKHGETFVSSHMATLLDVSRNDKKECDVIYRPEPILAEAACWIMYICKLNGLIRLSPWTVIRQACVVLQDDDIVAKSAGDRGEVGAAAAICFTMDNMRDQQMTIKNPYRADTHNMGCNIDAIDMLTALSGFKESYIKSKYSILDGYVCNANHFIRLKGRITRAQCELAVEYHCGMYVEAGTEGVDMILVLTKLMNDGDGGEDSLELMIVRIQVKNYCNDITVGETSKLFAKMTPLSCSPYVGNEANSIAIVFMVGRGVAWCVDRRLKENENCVASNNICVHAYQSSTAGGNTVHQLQMVLNMYVEDTIACICSLKKEICELVNNTNQRMITYRAHSGRKFAAAAEQSSA